MGVQDDQVEHLTPEQEAEADAQFEAAFNATRGEQPHAEGSTTQSNDAPADATGSNGQPNDEDTAAQAQADAQAAAQAAAEAEAARLQAEADAPVQLTKAQLAALQAQLAAIPHLQEELRKTRDTTAGKLGSIQQQMQSLADKAAAGQKPALKEMKRLREEFPELATIFEADLSDAFGSTEASAPGAKDDQGDGKANATPPAQHQVDPLADERVQQVLRQKDMAIVDVKHPDWRDLKATPEFNEWRQGLPPAAKDLLANTWDSQVMVDAFDSFKEWKNERSTKAAAQADAGKQRDRRLAAGTPVTTGVAATGRNAVDEDAEFEAGFNKVRSGRG